MGLRDRIDLPRGPLAGSILVAVVWVGLSLVFGSLTVLDLVVVAFLVAGGFARQRTKRPKPDPPNRGIYGPPS
jgi:hypothetical protein